MILVKNCLYFTLKKCAVHVFRRYCRVERGVFVTSDGCLANIYVTFDEM